MNEKIFEIMDGLMKDVRRAVGASWIKVFVLVVPKNQCCFGTLITKSNTL